MALKDQIFELLTPAFEQSGYFLEEIQVATPGKSRIITVIVDSDKTLNLDQVTVLSRQVGELLDNATFMGNTTYTLEVTSPGVDRPLTKPRHWYKNVGRLVKIVMSDGTTFSGRIKSSNEISAVIEHKGEDTVLFNEIKRAQIEVEFKNNAR
ncbi:MAG: hypothetical protein RLZ57_902 [Actinomycetota bacterium]|jgi:ribosome maturation factor RimP